MKVAPRLALPIPLIHNGAFMLMTLKAPKLLLLAILTVSVLVSLVAYSILIQPIHSQENTTTCEGILGYELTGDAEYSATQCEDAYTSCMANPTQYEEPEYSECTGECNKINRYTSWDSPSSCYGDWESRLPKPSAYSYTWKDSIIAYCTCIDTCVDGYTSPKDCTSALSSCCAEIVIPDEGELSPQVDHEPLTSDDLEITDLCLHPYEYPVEIQDTTKDRMREIAADLISRISARSDLTTAQKTTAKEVVQTASDDVIVQDCGEESYIGGCKWYTLYSDQCLYLDPLSSDGTIRHELGHLIAEALMTGYTQPGGNSSHIITGFSSTKHRAFDEALAHVIAMNLVGESTLSSVIKNTKIDPLTLPVNEKNAGYEIDLENKAVTAYRKDLNNTSYYGKGGDRGSQVKWIGPQTPAEIKAFERTIAELSVRIDAETNPGTKYKMMQRMAKFQQMLNPPGYSPKGEVAVASLIYDLTGGSASDERIGKILQATENFYTHNKRAPQSELEFLLGLAAPATLADIPDHGEDVIIMKILNTANNDKHRRNYTSDQLMGWDGSLN